MALSVAALGRNGSAWRTGGPRRHDQGRT